MLIYSFKLEYLKWKIWKGKGKEYINDTRRFEDEYINGEKNGKKNT